MIYGQREVLRKLFEQRVARLASFTISVLLSEEGGNHHRPQPAVTGPMRRNVHGTPDCRHHDPHIVWVIVVVHMDRRRGGGIGAVEDDLASAVRQDRVWEERQIFGVVRDTLPRIVEEK